MELSLNLPKRHLSKSPVRRKEYVYLLKLTTDEIFYKIGKSLVPLQRPNQVRNGLPVKLELMYYAEVSDMTRTENKLRKMFNDKRVKGTNDWFRLSPGEVEYIMNYHEVIPIDDEFKQAVARAARPGVGQRRKD